MGILQGKKVVVTGASSGIGKAIALRFGQEGAEIALLARRENRLKEVQSEINEAGGKAHIFKVDLSNPEVISPVFQEIRTTLGIPQILVNNAGTGFSGPVIEATLEQYDQTFALNMRALFLATKEVLPEMIKANEGTIINIVSIAGKMGLPNSAIYCASKFAVTGFSEAVLEEVREHNIRVSCIYPGRVHTELFGRKGSFSGKIENYIQPQDIAEAVLLCALGTQTATIKEIVVRPRRPVR